MSDYEVTWDATRKPPKPVLPTMPAHDDSAGQALWITSVLNLDPAHPVFAAVYQGLSDGGGHVELRRLNSAALRFEPASRIGNAQRLADTLVWQLAPTDGDPYSWSNGQATKIARVVRLLCGTTKERTTTQETSLIVSTYLEAATRAEGCTYGTSGQRYEAAVALRPEEDAYGRPLHPRYLVDTETGEIVIRVSDLARVARHVVGGSIAFGWLDARMEALGWDRRTLDGHALPGRPGRQGAHAQAVVYRGRLPEVDEGSVTK